MPAEHLQLNAKWHQNECKNETIKLSSARNSFGVSPSAQGIMEKKLTDGGQSCIASHNTQNQLESLPGDDGWPNLLERWRLWEAEELKGMYRKVMIRK